MKRVLLFVFAVISTIQLSAQCSELFISGYVEGYGNNRALEIYNPTSEAVNLSGYSVGRFSNGEDSPINFEGIQLPDQMLAPYDVYVAVVDKRDSLGTGLETPVWNGYQLWDVLIDQVTMEPVLDMNGDTIYSVQYDDNGAPLYGNVYHDWVDLQGKADGFFCPEYNVNNAMYFNGDDAVVLISGTEITDGSNIIDVMGVIGEDPGQSWVTSDSLWITRDRSLTRNPDIGGGTGIVATAQNDTIAYANWDISFKNDFSGLGAHECVCATSSVDGLNEVQFNMFPNPLVANELTIEAEEVIQQVMIYNLLGEVVLVDNAGSFAKQATINIPNLPNGIYAVSIAFENNKQSIQKLMIQQ